jgi:hypothetical protein
MPSPESKPTIENCTPVSFVTMSAIMQMFIRPAPFATPNSISVSFGTLYFFASIAASQMQNA